MGVVPARCRGWRLCRLAPPHARPPPTVPTSVSESSSLTAVFTPNLPSVAPCPSASCASHCKRVVKRATHPREAHRRACACGGVVPREVLTRGDPRVVHLMRRVSGAQCGHWRRHVRSAALSSPYAVSRSALTARVHDTRLRRSRWASRERACAPCANVGRLWGDCAALVTRGARCVRRGGVGGLVAHR